jgi:hypothetical protein
MRSREDSTLDYCSICGEGASARCMTCGRTICRRHATRSQSGSKYHEEYFPDAVRKILSERNPRPEYQSTGWGTQGAEYTECTECARRRYEERYEAVLTQTVGLLEHLSPTQALLTALVASKVGGGPRVFYPYHSTGREVFINPHIRGVVADAWSQLGWRLPEEGLLPFVQQVFRHHQRELAATRPVVALELRYSDSAPSTPRGQARGVIDSYGAISGWLVRFGCSNDWHTDLLTFVRPDGQICKEQHVRSRFGGGATRFSGASPTEPQSIVCTPFSSKYYGYAPDSKEAIETAARALSLGDSNGTWTVRAATTMC